MMNITPVRIHLLVGPQAGRVITLQNSPITFGRSVENTICFDIETLSRKHGEFVFTDTGWQYINHSNNGSKLNKKKVTTQPVPVLEQSTITVGRQKLFDFEVLPATPNESTPEQNEAAVTAELESKNSKRFKVYTILGSVYAIALLALVLLLSSLSSDTTTTSSESITNITPTQIRREITTDFDKEVPDERQVHALISEAKQQLALRDSEPQALFEALYALRKAQSYTKDRSFEDPVYNRMLRDLQEEMIAKLSFDLENAYISLTSRKYASAIESYELIERYYPANNQSSIYRALQHNMAVAIRAKKQR